MPIEFWIFADHIKIYMNAIGASNCLHYNIKKKELILYGITVNLYPQKPDLLFVF